MLPNGYKTFQNIQFLIVISTYQKVVQNIYWYISQSLLWGLNEAKLISQK